MSLFRRRNQRGAVIVEAAFVLPIFFLFVMTGIDFGDRAFQNTQAAHAARDGARQGILDPTNVGAISTAVAARLAGQSFTFGTSSGGVAQPICVHSNDLAELTGGCAAAVPGCSRIMVVVQWTRTAWTPFGQAFGTGKVRGEAEMTITGAPQVAGSTPVAPDMTGCS